MNLMYPVITATSLRKLLWKSRTTIWLFASAEASCPLTSSSSSTTRYQSTSASSDKPTPSSSPPSNWLSALRKRTSTGPTGSIATMAHRLAVYTKAATPSSSWQSRCARDTPKGTWRGPTQAADFTARRTCPCTNRINYFHQSLAQQAAGPYPQRTC